MSGVVVEVDASEVDELLGRQLAPRELNNRTRRALRAGGKVMREGLRAEARRRADLPRTFAKTRTRSHRNPLGVSVSPQSPLSNIFEHGSKTHTVGAPGQILSNLDKRREAGSSQGRPFFARGPVTVRGMAARPFIVPTFEANEDRAGDAAEKVLFEGIDR